MPLPSLDFFKMAPSLAFLGFGTSAIIAEPRTHGWVSAFVENYGDAFQGLWAEWVIAALVMLVIFGVSSLGLYRLHTRWQEGAGMLMVLCAIGLFIFGCFPFAQAYSGKKLPEIHCNPLWFYAAIGWSLDLFSRLEIFGKWRSDLDEVARKHRMELDERRRQEATVRPFPLASRL